MKLFLTQLLCTLMGHALPNLDGRCSDCGKVIASPLQIPPKWPPDPSSFYYQVEDDDYDSRN